LEFIPGGISLFARQILKNLPLKNRKPPPSDHWVKSERTDSFPPDPLLLRNGAQSEQTLK
jgi:hypothetical protein